MVLACIPGKWPQSPEHLKPQHLGPENLIRNPASSCRSVCGGGGGLFGPHLESSSLHLLPEPLNCFEEGCPGAYLSKRTLLALGERAGGVCGTKP